MVYQFLQIFLFSLVVFFRIYVDLVGAKIRLCDWRVVKNYVHILAEGLTRNSRVVISRCTTTSSVAPVECVYMARKGM